ncbi:MAG TPA: cytochrome c oxidase subunit 3 [Terriglobales bacterium]|nr:cytochrome c oxidase subunit 3 [Terriglobales bacterium]
MKQPKSRHGGGDVPHYPGGGGGGGRGDDSPDYGEHLRRCRLGLAVGIAPIVMLFVAFSSAYLVRQGLASWDLRTNSYINDWAPVHLPVLLLVVNTCFLLVSSLTMEFARRQAAQAAAIAPITAMPGIAADEQHNVPWLGITVALGLGFLAGQVLAWRQMEAHGIFLSSNPSSSFFYLLTGMHALHLAGGVVALLYATATVWLKRPPESRSVVIDVTAWYWHFMALLWLYIFALLEIAH